MIEVLFEQKYYSSEQWIPGATIDEGFYHRITFYDDSVKWFQESYQGGKRLIRNEHIVDHLERIHLDRTAIKLENAQKQWERITKSMKS